MSLRDLAERHLGMITRNNTTGFGWEISLHSPDGTIIPDPENAESPPLYGLSTDIGQMIDPNTGLPISGRQASIAIQISQLVERGFTDLPRGISDRGSLPWRVVFEDIGGESWEFKVTETMPDRAIGLVVCMLEAYQS